MKYLHFLIVTFVLELLFVFPKHIEEFCTTRQYGPSEIRIFQVIISSHSRKTLCISTAFLVYLITIQQKR